MLKFENFNFDKNFFIIFFFLKENLSKIHISINLEILIKKILILEKKNLNIFFLKFLTDFFVEYQISSDIIQKGLEFSEFYLNFGNGVKGENLENGGNFGNGANFGKLENFENFENSENSEKFENSNLLLIQTASIQIITLISHKILYRSDLEKIKISEKNLKNIFLYLQKNLKNDEKAISEILTIFSQFLEILEKNEKNILLIINFLRFLLKKNYEKNFISIIQKISEIFCEIFLKLKKNFFSFEILENSFFLIFEFFEIYEKNSFIIFLDCILEIFLSFICKFEIFCDFGIDFFFEKKNFEKFLQIFKKFENLVEKKFFEFLPNFFENLKTNEILAIFFSLLNISSKIFFLKNSKNLKILNFHNGEGSYCINYFYDKKNNIWIFSENEKKIDIKIENLKNLEFSFLEKLVKKIFSIISFFYENEKNDNFMISLDLFEFIIILFPFYEKIIFDQTIFFFQKIIKNEKILKIEKNNLFFTLNRILSRIFISDQNNFLFKKKKNFEIINFYLKNLKFSGGFQENLCIGIIIQKCFDFLIFGNFEKNENFLNLFSNLKIGNSQNFENSEISENSKNLENLKILIFLTEKILLDLKNCYISNNDIILENLKHFLLNEPHFQNLVEFILNPENSQILILLKRKNFFKFHLLKNDFLRIFNELKNRGVLNGSEKVFELISE